MGGIINFKLWHCIAEIRSGGDARAFFSNKIAKRNEKKILFVRKKKENSCNSCKLLSRGSGSKNNW